MLAIVAEYSARNNLEQVMNESDLGNGFHGPLKIIQWRLIIDQ